MALRGYDDKGMIACAPQKKKPTVSYGCFLVTSLRRADAIKPRGRDQAERQGSSREDAIKPRGRDQAERTQGSLAERTRAHLHRSTRRAPEVFAPHGPANNNNNNNNKARA